MSSSSGPRVDVIVPTRNRFELTAEAIESVRRQTYRRWHLYVVDDASDDGSADRLAELVAGDPRVTLVCREVRGWSSAARQDALAAGAQSPLVATLDSDDLWYPTKLERQLEFLLQPRCPDTRLDAVVCWHETNAVNGTRRGAVVRPQRWRPVTPFVAYNMSTLLMTRDLLDRMGGFLPDGVSALRTADYMEFFLRMTAHTELAVMPDVLAQCRHHRGERNSDAQGTLVAAHEAEYVLTLYDNPPTRPPIERAWLRAWTAARFLLAGDRSAALGRMASAIGVAGVRGMTGLLWYYAPFVARHLVLRPAARGVAPTLVSTAPSAAPAARDTLGPRRAVDAKPSLSVVVMGFRDGATIADAVRSVVEQASPEPFEVIVVTSGDDGSGLDLQARFPGVRVSHSDRRMFPGAARNAGVAMASAEAVAFLAADCRAEPGWVAGRIAAHRAGHDAVAGAVVCGGPNRPWAWAWAYELYFSRLPGRPGGQVAYPDSAVHGLSLSSSVLRRIGPFDERLRVGEDTDAARALAELGVPIWFDPAIRVSHPAPRTTLAELRDSYRRGRRAAWARRGGLRPATRRRVVIGFAPVWLLQVRRTAVTSWRYCRGERWRVVASLPWIAASRAARLAGWYGQRLADSRRGRARGIDGAVASQWVPIARLPPSRRATR